MSSSPPQAPQIPGISDPSAIAEENEITRLIQQAESDEKEARKIVEDITLEEKKLNEEYEKALAEYNESIRQLAIEEMIRDGEYDDPDFGPPITDIEQQAYNEQLAGLTVTFNAEQVAIQAKKVKAKELQTMGIIPPAAADNELEELYDEYEAGIKADEEANIEISGVALNSLITRATDEQKGMVDKFKKLVEAHNSFQKDFKQAILDFRFNKQGTKSRWGYQVSEQNREGTRDQCMYEKYHMRYMDMYCVYRRFLVLDPVEGKYDDFIEYRWDGAKWVKQNTTWQTGGSTLPNTPDIVRFFRDGTFPSDLPGSPEYWNQSGMAPSSGIIRFFNKPSSDYMPGRFNQKQAFKRCAPGYWFYENLPEEASICVHMGGSWVDSKPSYYPPSVGFSYKMRGTQAEAEAYKTAKRTPNPNYGTPYCNPKAIGVQYLGEYNCRQYLD